MAKSILGAITGLTVWIIIVTVAGLILRASWPEYASVASVMRFTLPMMVARLSIGALATFAMGMITAVIVKRSVVAMLVPSVLLLLMFIPQHVMIWDKFPVWYHLTFLLSLVPLTYLGGRITGLGRREAA